MQATHTHSHEQTQRLLSMLHLDGPIQITFIRAYSHVYRLDCPDHTFFLKMHTKDWYPPEDAETDYAVAHEASAWAILAAYESASPEVVLACQNRENPSGRSFLLTRQAPWLFLCTSLISYQFSLFLLAQP